MLLLGGPLHGQERDMPNGESELVVMAPSPGNPVPMPFRYEVKEIEAETRPGMVFRRTVLIDRQMPLEAATQMLATILLQRFAEELLRQFMEGGELVVRTFEMEPEQQSDSGLIIAKR